MLSRIAESLFWIGRYVERADDTARIVDVQVQRILEDPWLDEAEACASLLAVMGARDLDGPVDRRRLLDVLAYDPTGPGSIAGALAAARENARRAREVVSSEMWEALNTTYYAIPTRVRAASAHRFAGWVRERAAVVTGIADTTMSRDAGYQFLVLGRSLERADMTARLLATTVLEGGPSWQTVLHGCGAYEAFLRTYRGGRQGGRSDAQAAEFLLLDRLFPRSVVNALATAERCLEDLDPDAGRVGYADDARRTLAWTRGQLEFRSPDELLGDLAEEMQRVQQAASRVSDAVSRRYFPMSAGVAFTAEAI
ncbi:alpha-E domain-containing protein [Aquipuribacter nitratireducens]|uniref:Alpha-E domain-containing protein n=1 Tax=Aquipuribacter nitratireducens TaxID=650104 RepID=A0ABW0GJF1_9MICO